jgi:hypothetical protein
LAVTAVSVSGLRADDPKQPEPPVLPKLDALPLGAIKAPTLDQAREQAFAYLKALPDGTSKWPAAQAIWSTNAGRTLLDRTVDSFCLADPVIAQFVQSARLQPHTSLLETPVLKNDKQPAYVRNNLKLFLARALTSRRLHEDGLALLRTLTPETLVDPASYYFYRSVCENKLRLKDDGLLSTHRLLTSMQQDAPERYLVVAQLMQDEMIKWEDQDLADVARRMEEIEARLDNARGGPKTIEKQKEVVSLLDKIIKEMEDSC